jgi:hypothetical protein
MRESTTESKEYLTFDTDWISLVSAVGGLLLCLLWSVRSKWRVFTHSPIRVGFSWYAVIAVVLCVGIIRTVQERILKFGFVLLGISLASRILLYVTHAPITTQMQNAEVMRVVDATAFVALCVCLVQWLRAKVKHA